MAETLITPFLPLLRRLLAGLVALFLLIVPAAALATPYGGGSYGASAYAGCSAAGSPCPTATPTATASASASPATSAASPTPVASAAVASHAWIGWTVAAVALLLVGLWYWRRRSTR